METLPLALDFEQCYRAISSRDTRFDGRFFTAVSSTGIYCRPICPAQTPKREHTHFYTHAAAAEAAGFRACRRCHPEVAPTSPDWNIRADLVARALHLIAEGVIDSMGVAGVADKLGISVRHLSRLLVAEVGVGPLALARTRRAQTARLLIDQTDLSLTTIAFAAGFASLRQFNETMQAVFGCPPSELRRRGQKGEAGTGVLTLRLTTRPPYDGAYLLNFLGQRTTAGTEEVSNGSYRRTVRFARSAGIIELTPQPDNKSVILRLQLDNLEDLPLIVQRCREFFDLDADPEAIATVLGNDLYLQPLILARPGLRIPGATDGFEQGVRAILGQQISVQGARTLAGRIVAAVGEPIATPTATLTHYFPTPQQLAVATLDGLGITGGRIKAIHALAAAVVAGEIQLTPSADREQVSERLLALPGIGPWTVAYIRLRALGDPNAFLPTDLGIRRAMERLQIAADAASITARAETWRPWGGYALIHLWASLEER